MHAERTTRVAVVRREVATGWRFGRVHSRNARALLAAALSALAVDPWRQVSAQETPLNATPQSPPLNESQGFFEIVLSGGPVGWVIMFLLLGLSVTSVYLVIDQLITIRRATLMPDGLADQIQQLLAGGRVREADEACRARPSFLSFVVVHGLSEVEGGWTATEKALEDALAEQAARLLRKTEYLSVIGNIAPMVGLLGTVTGMIMAFQRVAVTQGSAGAADLAEGIYQALVTTVGGLIVAIPSLGAFAIFRNRVDQFVAEVAYLAQHVFVPLKRRSGQSRRPDKSPPAPPAP